MIEAKQAAFNVVFAVAVRRRVSKGIAVERRLLSVRLYNVLLLATVSNSWVFGSVTTGNINTELIAPPMPCGN